MTITTLVTGIVIIAVAIAAAIFTNKRKK